MINLTKGWIKISKKELDTLRKGIFESYIKNGGTKSISDFNSFLNNPDPRFYASIKNLSNCNFIGARSVYKKTILDKLFSSYLPTFNEYVSFIDELKSYSCIGEKTQIEIINEKYVDEAINIMTKQNIIFEPSGIAGVVMLLQMKDTIPKDKKILIINTGKTKSADTLMENLKQIKR